MLWSMRVLVTCGKRLLNAVDGSQIINHGSTHFFWKADLVEKITVLNKDDPSIYPSNTKQTILHGMPAYSIRLIISRLQSVLTVYA
jgi:hypothetical protein